MPGGLLQRYRLERDPACAFFPLDTFGDWLDALEERYLEGIALAHEGLDAGFAYLFGYVAEMYLKCAICEVIGLLPNDYVFDPANLTRASAIVRLRLEPKHIKSHNLERLVNLLIDVRSASGRAVPLVIDSSLRALVVGNPFNRGLADDWSESLRYRAGIPSSVELARITDAVEWLRTNYGHLK